MKLYFRQRFFSWLDSYDIYDELDRVVYQVEGKFSLGHCLHVLNADGEHVATLKEKLFRFLPEFWVYQDDEPVGKISKKLAFLCNDYKIDYKGWSVSGDPLGWDYEVLDSEGLLVAKISKELFQLTDTYILDVCKKEDALSVLMLVLAIDAEKCSNKG